MDPLVDLLSEVVPALEKAGIDYAVIGSVASSLQGEPHASLDVDLIVRMTPESAGKLSSELPRRFYFTPEMLAEAARNHGIANLIDNESSFKVDLSAVEATPFFETVLKRREMKPFGPDAPAFYVVTAEDIILMKLLWRKDSRSQKQWRDARGVVRVRSANLDWQYLFQQATALGIGADIEQLRDDAGV